FSSACPSPPPALHSFPTRRSSDLCGAMGGDAVVAAVLGRDGGGDHLLLDLGEARLFLHDGVAIAHEAFEPGHVKGEGLEYIRHRSEEHTSELQSRSDLVCRLLLEK